MAQCVMPPECHMFKTKEEELYKKGNNISNDFLMK